MIVQDFGLDAVGRSIRVYWNGDNWNDLTILVDGSIVGRVPGLEELNRGTDIILKDGTALKVQMVRNTLQVLSNGRPLSGGHKMSPGQQQPSSDGSRRKRISLGGVIILLSIVGMYWSIVWLIPETQLARSGIAAQGTVVDARSGGCGRNLSAKPVTVQFTDLAGRLDTSTISCDYGIFYVNPGESITIVYLPDNPTVIAPRDELSGTYQVHAVSIILVGLIELSLLSIWIVRRVRKQRRVRSASLLTHNT